MEFGIFYEHQIPRPWDDDGELTLYQEALEQVELADRVGFDYAWEVEHHFLEEYSHSSAPEVFLAACAGRTEQIRLGHGIKLMPPAFNHPVRSAEQVATLDLVSGGRVEFGTGEAATNMELEGFGISLDEKESMWEEAVEQVANMMALEPYPGYEGEYFSVPCRNVLPKPVQEPHPPLWVACTDRDTIREAAKHGLGALTFAFGEPEEARGWVDDYYSTLKESCVPLGRAINPNIAMVSSFSCHPDRETAIQRGIDGFQFFGYALVHYGTNRHRPGRMNLWQDYEAVRDELDEDVPGGIGTPEMLRDHLREFEKAGVDQVIFLQQGGRNRHRHIRESLEVFAEEVMPEFHERHPAREEKKREELAPYLERAMKRKDLMQPPDDEEVPHVEPPQYDEPPDLDETVAEHQSAT